MCVRVYVCASVSAIKCLAFACFDCNYSPRRVRHLYFHFFVSAVSLHAFVVCVVLLLYLLWVACVPRVDFAILKVFTQAGRGTAYNILCMYWFLAAAWLALPHIRTFACRCTHLCKNTHTHTYMHRHTPNAWSTSFGCPRCVDLLMFFFGLYSYFVCALCNECVCVCKCSFVYVCVCVCASSLIYAFAETTSACNGIHLS